MGIADLGENIRKRTDVVIVTMGDDESADAVNFVAK